MLNNTLEENGLRKGTRTIIDFMRETRVPRFESRQNLETCFFS